MQEHLTSAAIILFIMFYAGFIVGQHFYIKKMEVCGHLVLDMQIKQLYRFGYYL